MSDSLQKIFLFLRLAKLSKRESINMGFVWLHAEGEMVIPIRDWSQSEPNPAFPTLSVAFGESLALFTEGRTQGKQEHQSFRFQKRREALNPQK